MAKYFQDSRELPRKRIDCSSDSLTAERIDQELNLEPEGITLCVRLPGFAQDSLGYVFVLLREEPGLRVLDICQTVGLDAANAGEVLEIVRHCSGLEYSDKWYERLYTLRNDRQ